ncbi:hypothetical protein RJ640_024376 [Escallonia rubra]|uniref:Uncharacterized protein n=1 Tax=Escallonia rubra TaxID=112253 RepID=A0AA88UD16_9ASTE|nr:hypothetical protein RJ640_024376 [Escallonia rubra]
MDSGSRRSYYRDDLLGFDPMRQRPVKSLTLHGGGVSRGGSGVTASQWFGSGSRLLRSSVIGGHYVVASTLHRGTASAACVSVPLALHIEALKEGEEPVSFGPNSVLVDYGDGWKLQTVTETQGLRSGKYIRVMRQQDPAVKYRTSAKTYAELAQETGLPNVYVAQILKCQALLSPEAACMLRALPGLPEDPVLQMMEPPRRSYDPLLIQDPAIYR